MLIEPLVFTALVADTKDPEGLGRVKVKLQGWGETVDMPWLRLVTPGAAAESGWVWLPEKDEEVLVLRGAGNQPDGMFVLGSVYNGKTKPKVTDADGKNDTKQILTRGGTVLTISDTAGEEKLTIATKDAKLSLVFDVKAGSVTITGDKAITLTSNTAITVEAKEVTVKGAETVALSGGSSSFSLKGDATISVEAKTVEVKAQSVLLG